MGEAPRAYCANCEKNVPFVTQGRQQQVVRNGKAYTYRRQIAVCGKCGAEISYAPFEQAAEQALEDAVANGVGLATPEQIRRLPLQYAIGKRPLSRLLGWGELTYTRLLDGRTPNEAHSAEIVHLLENPTAYARMLEIGYEKGLITGTAYEKSRRAVNTLLAESVEGGSASGNPMKAFAVADRLCALADGDLTPRMLQTLMRIAQEASLDDRGEALFEAEGVDVEWGYEYPQIAAAYSFADIQAAAERLRCVVTAISEDAETGETEEADPEAEDETASAPERTDAAEAAEAAENAELVRPAEEPEEDSKASKKGKKGKKGKKSKKEKKGKKTKRNQGIEAPTVAEASVEPKPKPAMKSVSTPAPTLQLAKATRRQGPLSPAECQLIDDVFTRYKTYIEAGLAHSFR